MALTTRGLAAKYSPAFAEFIKQFKEGNYARPQDVPTDIFALPDWERLTRTDAEALLLPFIRYNVERAMRTMPEVYQAYRRLGVKPENILTIEDFWNLPVLPKDPSSGTNMGLREKILKDPYLVRPNDLSGQPIDAYFSGGTKGKPAPTWITEWDLEVESTAFARAMQAGGIKPQSIVINCYNPSHKGGEAVHRALKKLGCVYVNVKTTDKAPEISGYIQDYTRKGHEVVFVGAQPPIKDGDRLQKGAGRTFLEVAHYDAATFEDNVNVVLLGGFRLVPEVEQWSRDTGKPAFTIFGATEILPAFFGTATGPENRHCTGNNLHVMYGPHYVELLKQDRGRWVPATPGENGIIAFTSVFREGTLYLRYIIGDQAQFLRPEGPCACGSQTEIYNDIRRIDNLEDILKNGCVAD